MYKKTVDNNGIIKISSGTFIPDDDANSDYQGYLKWLSDGNAAEASMTFDELKEHIIESINSLGDKKIDAAAGTGQRAKINIIVTVIKQLRKEFKGNASQSDIDNLDQKEALSNYVDTVRSEIELSTNWINDPSRLFSELEAFDPQTDVNWPVIN